MGIPKTILVDIDGVLAWQNETALLQTYNESFRLGISDEVMQTLETVEQLEALSEMQAFHTQIGDVKYDHLMLAMQHVPSYLASLNVISHAVEGVQCLAQYAEVGYCTARYGMNEKWDKALRQATRHWLTEKSFVHPEQTEYCGSPRGKLQRIVEELKEEPQAVLLIDDLYQRLLEEYDSLERSEQQLLQEHLTIGAYRAGQDEEWKDAPVRVLPLRQWRYVEDFVQLF